MSNVNSELINILTEATGDLRWMSESDYPFQVFVWEERELTAEQLREKTGHAPDSPLETKELEQFFAPALREYDWHDEEDKETVRRYRSLGQTLQYYLSDIRVYRLGEVEIDVYIIGKTRLGNLAVLATKAVET